MPQGRRVHRIVRSVDAGSVLKIALNEGTGARRMDNVRRAEGLRWRELEVIARGQVVMKLPGVPEPEGFRQAVLNSVKAWVPEKAKGAWIAASANVEGKG